MKPRTFDSRDEALDVVISAKCCSPEERCACGGPLHSVTQWPGDVYTAECERCMDADTPWLEFLVSAGAYE